MVEPEHRRAGEGDDVTASEAAVYAFCAKAWHLEHVLLVSPDALCTPFGDTSSTARRSPPSGRARPGVARSFSYRCSSWFSC